MRSALRLSLQKCPTVVTTQNHNLLHHCPSVLDADALGRSVYSETKMPAFRFFWHFVRTTLYNTHHLVL